MRTFLAAQRLDAGLSSDTYRHIFLREHVASYDGVVQREIE
jgi:hypothetical protein